MIAFVRIHLSGETFLKPFGGERIFQSGASISKIVRGDIRRESGCLQNEATANEDKTGHGEREREKSREQERLSERERETNLKLGKGSPLSCTSQERLRGRERGTSSERGLRSFILNARKI